ncbi:hypothetical protein VP01_10023g1, partial [Puccinia sorghi]
MDTMWTRVFRSVWTIHFVLLGCLIDGYVADSLFNSIIVQELANPLVRAHLNFYPHENYGKNIFAYQSMKWLPHLGREHQVQMSKFGEPIIKLLFQYCLQPSRYDICKICSSTNNQIPAHIDYHSSMLEDILVSDFGWAYSEVTLPEVSKFIDSCGEMDGKDLSYIEVPNPWRTKSRGKLIYHMPIN